MSPTLLELAVGIILLVVAWQIGVAIAPNVLGLLRRLKGEVDTAADDALAETPPVETSSYKEEHRNGTHR